MKKKNVRVLFWEKIRSNSNRTSRMSEYKDVWVYQVVSAETEMNRKRKSECEVTREGERENISHTGIKR